ncbi:hypothetical protein PENTCL1PPCAC_22124, partial [Pristionchus entomophagus]
ICRDMEDESEPDKLKLSDDNVPPREEKSLSVLDLPLEMNTRIIEKLDFPTRLALRKSCQRLYSAEASAKMNIAELLIYRTSNDNYALVVKDKLSDTLKIVRIVEGVPITQSMHKNNPSFIRMMKDFRETDYQEYETPLGELATTIQDHLNRSTVDSIDINGFLCSDSSMTQLCGLMRDKPIHSLLLQSTFSTTSDDRLFELIFCCPKLRSAILAMHRCTPKDIVVEKEFLLLATSRLETLIVQSCVLNGTYSTDDSVVDDDLLIRLLSAQCSHLELFYYLPLLTAEGIFAAIKLIAKSDWFTVEFKAYIRSELIGSVVRLLLTEDNFTGRQISITMRMVNVVSSDEVILDSNVKVRVTEHSLDYSKIVIRKEPASKATPIIMAKPRIVITI